MLMQQVKFVHFYFGILVFFSVKSNFNEYNHLLSHKTTLAIFLKKYILSSILSQFLTINTRALRLSLQNKIIKY